MPRILAVLLGSMLGSQSALAIAFEVYIGAPGDMTSNLPGITEETFSGLTPTNTTWANGAGYSSILGTYKTDSGTSKILANTIYGAGTGDYMSLEPNAVVSLQLTEAVSYFGFAWPAGDDLNIVTVYKNNTPIFTLKTADIISFLEAPTVTAVDSTVYTSTDYYGDPSSGNNSGEPYGYIHIVGAEIGSTFDKLTFSHLRQGGEFETDNHAVLFDAVPTLQGDWVFAYDSADLAVPEPNTYALIAGIAALLTITRRRHSLLMHH